MNNQYKELKRNTLIIAIGNIGSKAISFILAPLYSYFLLVSEYGTQDLITTTVSLLTPIVCLDVFEASFRFACDVNENKEEILSSSIKICSGAFIVFAVIFLYNFIIPNDNSVLIAGTSLYIAINSLVMVFAHYNRGIGRIGIYAYSGIVNSVALLLTNIILMILLRLGLLGWFISYLLAKLCQLIYLLINTDLRNISLKKTDKKFLKGMLSYCIPLLPNQTMWWIMNASDRYVLAAFAGVEAIGLYSAGNKIPHILSMFENVFFQSWQSSAISNMESKYRDTFYSSVFNGYFSILTVGVLALLVICRPAIEILWENSYNQAWLCVAPLVVGVLVHALGGNLGAFYAVYKKPKGALYTSLAGALVNIVLNLIFIPIYGFIAASVTTLVGYIVTLLLRWIDMKNYIHITLNHHKTIVYVLLICMQTILYYINASISYTIRIVIALTVFFNEKNMLLNILKRSK